ncbi:hypothetical protein FNH13_11895 [Ornithinimicrobium ciconiae]|uniref:Uncharacterized protein n=1 Tax=Ornithinimicrobium ciconiae TaxID=2594265 RepID=A0A516GBR2_9MICO|nr:hypothetical protein [Ornithinimicrobium ciconiae]QDO88938.1 hypothetical protein FNH13_11895 [Ornithinimicrobium ciconiae]
MTQPPQTGDSHVDETLAGFHATRDQPLQERAEAALQAQRRLQERLTESSPGQGPSAPMARVAGAGRPTA